MKYAFIILLSGCSVNASIGEYKCDKETSDKRAEFVSACYSPEHNNMSSCLNAATRLFCEEK